LGSSDKKNHKPYIGKKNMNEQRPIDPAWDPDTELRADLWPTMTLTQLSRQQEMVIDRMNQMHSIMGSIANPSMSNIYGALSQAIRDLTGLIENRAQQKPQKPANNTTNYNG
jgi:hypothetical protein